VQQPGVLSARAILKSDSARIGAISAFERTNNRTEVLFTDGNDPWEPKMDWWRPIGEPFETFCDMIVDKLKLESTCAPPVRIPKTSGTWARWRKAYSIWQKMNQAHLDNYDFDPNYDAKPSLNDFRDRVISVMKWSVTTRTLQDVIRAGEAGFLRKRKKDEVT
jgi:hypothetical protein